MLPDLAALTAPSADDRLEATADQPDQSADATST
jgi:hypothetical protein